METPTPAMETPTPVREPMAEDMAEVNWVGVAAGRCKSIFTCLGVN